MLPCTGIVTAPLVQGSDYVFILTVTLNKCNASRGLKENLSSLAAVFKDKISIYRVSRNFILRRHASQHAFNLKGFVYKA
jgi:hypothetical protein